MRFSRTTTVVTLFLLLLVTRITPPLLLKVFGNGFQMHGLQYLWNFSPLWGTCLFCGAMFRNRALAFGVPLAAQFVGDAFYWGLSGDLTQGFGMVQFLNYILVACCIIAGMTLSRTPSPSRLMATGTITAVGYFVASNLLMWALTPWYAHTLEGLTECFVMAVPFFPTTVASTLVYSYGLFAILGRAEEPADSLEETAAPV